MLQSAVVVRRALFCFSSLLIASCGSPARKVEIKPAAVAAATGDVQERAAAYAERLRLGLGSPYRLIETAARDQRLGAAAPDVARTLFAQIERGELYQVSPRALMAAGLSEPAAIAQLELIERAVTSASNPLIGELAVNLAYELALAERTVTPVVAARTARVAALVRDRELALADAKLLRTAARSAHDAPEHLVIAWREQHRFAVEQPTLAPLDAAAQGDAARLALLLAGGIRSAMTPVSSMLQLTAPATEALLTPEAAATLLRDSTGSEQAALTITLRSRLTEAQQRTFEHAGNEERFVAALALARRDSGDDVAAANAALEAAIALRPFAQERLVRDSITPQDLTRRFGVRVRFARGVTETQRADALRQLAHALDDLRSVIRTIELNGLTFEIGRIDPAASHLAFHDPRRRVIRLDPATMAGTIAHEVAHDLDWQLATRKYKTRANYATDYATRNRRALAYAVESLSSSSAEMAQQNADDAAARRPAEIFARRFEWYVASALALQGRSSGYLSSVQSDWIAGYGSAVRPEAGAGAAKSFAALVAEATNMDRSDLAAVGRTVVESSPVVVRILKRANDATTAAQLRLQTLNELREWECSSAWQAAPGNRSSLYAYVDVLGAAASHNSATMLPLEPVRVYETSPITLNVGGCNRLGGVLLAHPGR